MVSTETINALAEKASQGCQLSERLLHEEMDKLIMAVAKKKFPDAWEEARQDAWVRCGIAWEKWNKKSDWAAIVYNSILWAGIARWKEIQFNKDKVLSLDAPVKEDSGSVLADFVLKTNGTDENISEKYLDLITALESLPKKFQHIIKLVYGIGGGQPLSVCDAAKKLNITHQGASFRLSKARQLLAQKLLKR